MSHDYVGSLNLHSRKKPVATRKEGELKGGIKREELSAKSQLIFDVLNNKDAQGNATDAILDANEMQNFWDMLRTAAKDDTLGGREASKVLKELGLKELKKEDLYAFINELYGESEDIESSLVDDEGTIIINYKENEDGEVVQERVHTDHSSEIETTDSDETVTTQFKNADGNLTKQTVIDKDNNGKTTMFTDEKGNVVLSSDGQEVPTGVVLTKGTEEIYSEAAEYERNQDDTYVYDDKGQPVLAKRNIKDSRNSSGTVDTTINYESGIPISATEVRGTKTSNYVYQEGKPVLANTVEDLGNDLQRTTNYEWTENGHIEHITEPDKTIERTVVNFPTEDNKVVPLTTQEVITQGTTTTTNLYGYNQKPPIKQETIVDGNNKTQNMYQMVPNEEGGVTYAKLLQTKSVNNKTYQVQYDGEGNTCGIIVQFDSKEMNISSFCRKFGVNETKFRAINGLRAKQKTLKVGQEVKIPKELEADAKILQNRDTAEVARAKQEQRRQYEAQLKKLGWDGKASKYAGKKYTYNGKTYTVLGEKTTYERVLVQDAKGRIYTAAWECGGQGPTHPNWGKKIVLLDETYTAITDYHAHHPEARVPGFDARHIKTPTEVKTTTDGQQYIDLDGFVIGIPKGANAKDYINGVNGNRDAYGHTNIIRYSGSGNVSFHTLSCSSDIQRPDGKRYFVDRENYLPAFDAYMENPQAFAQLQNCNGDNLNISYVTGQNGQTYFFSNGHAVDGNTVLQERGKEIAQVLETAADNKDAWYNEATDFALGWAGVDATMGTDNDKQQKALDALKKYAGMVAGSCQEGGSPGTNVYAMTNANLSAEYQNNEQGYDAVQTICLQENSHGFVQTNMTPIITNVMPNASTVQIKQFGQFSANEIQHEINGYTGTADLKRALGTVVSSEQRRAMENNGFDAVAAIKDDGWSDIETRAFQAVWVKNNAYEMATLAYNDDGTVKLDANGNPVYANAGDQAIRNQVIGDLISDDDDEYIQIGLDSVNTKGLVKNGPSADYLFFEKKAAEICAERGYQQQYEGQTAGQQFIAGISTDDGKVDADDVRKYNTKLFDDEWTTEAKTAPIIYEVRQGNYNNVFADSDPAVYEELTIQMACGEIPGCNSLRDLYDKAIGKAEDVYERTKLTMSVAASGQSTILSDKELVTACVMTMHLLDGEYKTADHMAEAALLREQLTKIISDRPELKSKLLKLISKANITRSRYVAFGNDVVKDRTNYWTSFVNTAAENAIYKSEESAFLDENGQPITDSAKIQALINTNSNVVSELETYLAQLEREFNISVNEEGVITRFGRSIASSNIDMRTAGTYEEDMRVLYTQLRNVLPKLRLAAKGQLRDSKGQVLSCKDLLTPFQQQIDTMAQKNNDFVTTGQYAKMGVILAPVILTTIAASGGAAAAGWSTLAVAGVAGGTTFVTEYGLNTLDEMTSRNGLTREKNAENLWQAVTDGALAASGVAYSEVLTGAKMTSFLNKVKIKNPHVQNVTKLTSVMLSDTAASAFGEYVMTGDITVEGMAYNAIFSVAGNIISLKPAGHSGPDAGNLHNPGSQSVLDVATVDGTALSGGKFNPEKFGTAVTEVQASVANGLTPEQHVHLLHEASLHQSSGAGASAQGKALTHIVEDGTGVFTGGKHGDIDISAETDITKLQSFRKEVAGWNDPNRDIDGILAMIDGRIEHLNAHPELIGTPVQSQVLDLYNAQLVEQTDALLAPKGKNGKNFKIGEADTSLIIERINKTNSLEDLDAIVAGIEHRRLGGTKQSLIDDMLKAVDSRKLQLRPEIDMDGFNTLIAAKNGAGLNEGEVLDVVRLIEKSTDEEFAQIETAVNSNSKIKKQSQIKKAIEARKAKVGETPANTAAHVEEPVATPHEEPTSNVSHTSDEPATGLHTDEAPVEVSTVHTDETPSVVKASEEIHQSVVQDVEVIDAEIPSIHKSAWTKIKNELHDLQGSLQNGVKNLGARCKSVLQDLQSLASKLSPGALKTKIQKLISDFKLQLMDNGIMKPKNCTLTKSAIGADGTAKTIEITYNSQGLETKKVYKHQDGTLDGEINITYDANNKIKTEILKDAEGNITEHYYENGEIVKTIKKDAEGNIVSETNSEPTNAPVVEEQAADIVEIEEVIEPESVVHTDTDEIQVAEVVSDDVEIVNVVPAESSVVNPAVVSGNNKSTGVTPTNSNPKIAALIEKYRNKASHITNKTFTIDGKPTTFEVLHGTQGGSNDGYFVINKETGDLYYAKIPNGGAQWKAEIAATKLYQAAGIDAPEITMFTVDGKDGVLSKFIPDLQPLDQPHVLANDGFGMDVLLENWDSIGLAYDNTLITADGSKVVKLDNGGSFDYKAQGQKKPFTTIPMELISMVDPGINPTASTVFGKMSRNDLISSLERAANLKDIDIDNILNQCGCPQYAETLKKRRAFIQDVVTEMKNTPQLPNESTLQYMQKVTYAGLEKTIAKASTSADLDSVIKALDTIKDPAVKHKLTTKISNKLAEINSPVVKVVESEPVVHVDSNDIEIINAEPIELTPIQDFTNAQIGDIFPPNQEVVVSANTKLKLADQFEIDFNHSAMKAKLDAMKDGDVLIVGRDPGLDGYKIPDAFIGVSRKHLKIEKFGDQFIVTDISKNGTKFAGISAPKETVTIGSSGVSHLSNTDVHNLLTKSGFTQNFDGTYRFNMDSSFENELVNHFGYGYGNEAKKLYQRSLTAHDVDNITMMINEASKVIDVSELDINRVVLLYNSIQNGNTHLFTPANIAKMTPAKWAMVMNCAKGKTISASQLQAMMNYKYNSSEINGGLTNLKNGQSIGPNVQKQIDDLSAYIDTQVISEDIQLQRIEGYFGGGNPYGCLGSTTYKGKSLDKVLEEAIAGGPSAIMSIENEINFGTSGRLVATNERFTSAAVLPGAVSGGSGRVVWDLTLKKGSKGAFLEGNNFDGALSNECEILLQKNSQFEITGILWNDSIGKWIVKADVTN